MLFSSSNTARIASANRASTVKLPSCVGSPLGLPLPPAPPPPPAEFRFCPFPKLPKGVLEFDEEEEDSGASFLLAAVEDSFASFLVEEPLASLLVEFGFEFLGFPPPPPAFFGKKFSNPVVYYRQSFQEKYGM